MRHDHASVARVGGLAEGVDSRLAVLSREPFNAESRPEEQLGLITPIPAFFKRNHFPIPALSSSEWRLALGGTVKRPIELTYGALRALPRRSLVVTLECAGNGRVGMHPPAEGEPWHYGAVSTAEWTGVPLACVLEAAGATPAAREIVVAGADAGYVEAAGAEIRFTRSLPLARAMHEDTLLAYAMNGEPLAPEHGFPLRLIVPGWYGMASVKWVTRIDATTESFQGFYQADRYVMVDPARRDHAPIPLTTIAVRSLICWPAEGETLPVGMVLVRGYAWSGSAPVARVQVSADEGRTWEDAEFTGAAGRYAWRPWEYTWRPTTPGAARLTSRAYDAEGNVQPHQPLWNALGYANNAVHAVQVSVPAVPAATP